MDQITGGWTRRRRPLASVQCEAGRPLSRRCAGSQTAGLFISFSTCINSDGKVDSLMFPKLSISLGRNHWRLFAVWLMAGDCKMASAPLSRKTYGPNYRVPTTQGSWVTSLPTMKIQGFLNHSLNRKAHHLKHNAPLGFMKIKIIVSISRDVEGITVKRGACVKHLDAGLGTYRYSATNTQQLLFTVSRES